MNHPLLKPVLKPNVVLHSFLVSYLSYLKSNPCAVSWSVNQSIDLRLMLLEASRRWSKELADPNHPKDEIRTPDKDGLPFGEKVGVTGVQ